MLGMGFDINSNLNSGLRSLISSYRPISRRLGHSIPGLCGGQYHFQMFKFQLHAAVVAVTDFLVVYSLR